MLGGLRRLLRRRAEASTQYLEKLFSALDELYELCAAGDADEDDLLRVCCETVARELDVERVSLWRLDDDDDTLLCVFVYTSSKNAYSLSPSADMRRAPDFLRLFRTRRSISVDDVERDAGVADMAAAHFRAVGIRAVTQARVYGAQGNLGLFAASMTSRPRPWLAEEISFVSAVAGLIGVIWDRAEKRRIVAELQATRRRAELAHRRLIDAIEALPDGFVLFDAEDRMVLCNEQYRRLYAPVADVIQPGRTFEDMLRTGLARGAHPEAVDREEEWFAQRFAAHKDPKGPIEQRIQGDRYLRIEERRTAGGDTVGFRIDITELKRQQRRLEELTAALVEEKARAEQEALHDGLTGLPNRRHLDRRLQELVDSRSEDLVYALHVDLDRFKHINDTLGHAAGDHVLSSVAEALQNAVRDDDFVARIGGDEFVILCGDIDANTASMIAERVVAELAKPVEFEGQPCHFGASVGVASTPARRARDLLVRADAALYEAKGGGRGRVELFDSALERRMTDKKRLIDEILRGLEREEFEPFFQPQFDARDFSVVGVEAVARWRHPERGLLRPDAFLQVAAELKVLGRLDRTIFRRAVDACGAFAAAGAPTPKLSVNVSLERIRDAEIAQELTNMSDFAPAVAFELLETIYLDDAVEADWSLDTLRELGIELELDDFGSGRASITALLKLQPKRLKIDRDLVMPITSSEGHLKIVKAIVQIGQSQGVSIIAEGVETVEHVRLLREVGCNTLQGFYFARPMSASEYLDFALAQAWPSPEAIGLETRRSG